MKKMGLVLAIVMALLVPLGAQTIDNGILLMVTRPAPNQVRLDWADLGNQTEVGFHLYLVYASDTPTDLGNLVYITFGTGCTLPIPDASPDLYFQVLRLRDLDKQGNTKPG